MRVHRNGRNEDKTKGRDGEEEQASKEKEEYQGINGM